MANITIHLKTPNGVQTPVEMIWHDDGRTAEIKVGQISVFKSQPSLVSEWFYARIVDLCNQSAASMSDEDMVEANDFFFLLSEQVHFMTATMVENMEEIAQDNAALALNDTEFETIEEANNFFRSCARDATYDLGLRSNAQVQHVLDLYNYYVATDEGVAKLEALGRLAKEEN